MLKLPKFKSEYALPIIILSVIVVGALVAVFTSNLKHDPYEDGRKAADNFMQAFVTCDFDTARRYYTLLQTSPDKLSEYKKTCKKGAQYTFSQQLEAATTTKNGLVTKEVSYVYNFHAQGGFSGALVAHMLWNSETNRWQVTSLTPATSTTNSNNTTRH